MRGRLTAAAHVWAIMELLPLIRLRSEPQTPSPKGEGRAPENTTPTAKKSCISLLFPRKVWYTDR